MNLPNQLQHPQWKKKHQDAEIKKSCTIDDDNNKSASKKKNNDGKSSDNVSTAKEDEGRSTSKEIVDETQLLMVHPKILLTHLLQGQRRMEVVLTRSVLPRGMKLRLINKSNKRIM